MYENRYESYKYVMQDVYQVYIGAKYTFEEVVENEEIPFKFRLLVERYVWQDVDPDTTLESHFYYLDEKGLIFKTYKHIKLRVKINIMEERKTLTGKRVKEYTTRMVPIEELVRMSPAEKEKRGVVIQEICCSKLALMTF